MESSNRNKHFRERLGKDILVIGSALLVMAVTIGVSSGSPGDLAAFKAQYGAAVTDKFSCRVCHTTPPALNPYGSDYLYSGHNFSAIEFLDSYGDGSANIVKINACRNPGGAASSQRAAGGSTLGYGRGPRYPFDASVP